jgi:hypothetical protein
MVINADGITLNGVAPSVWSLWYSFLAMIQLPRYSCALASYDTSNHVCAGPFGRTAQIGLAETDRSTGRWHRLTCQGPEGSRERFAESTARRSSMYCLRDSWDQKIVRHSPQSRSGCLFACFPSERAKRIRRTWVRSLGLQFRRDE